MTDGSIEPEKREPDRPPVTSDEETLLTPLGAGPPQSDETTITTRGGENRRPAADLGPYRILEELGRGGQGQVYLAHDRRLDRLVALKVLSPAYSLSAAARMRFRREATTASKLDHPGICTVYEVGESGGTLYIAMQHVDGEPLSAAIARAAATPARDRPSAPPLLPEPSVSETGGRPADSSSARGQLMRTVHFFERCARALHVAHESGLVHRDIKPGNIMVTREGDPVLLDFGLARDEVDEAPSLTGTGDVLGTPAYMSPEQIDGGAKGVDRRADVYALGVSLYECLTLRRPFRGATREALYREILTRDPADACRTNAAIPHDLGVVLETTLAKDPAGRYLTAADLAEDLRRVRELEPIQARPPGPLVRAGRWFQRNPALGLSLSAVFLLLAGGLVVVSYLYAQAQANEEEAERNARKARDNAAEAQRRYVQARSTAGFIVDEVADKLRYVLGAAAIRQTLLEESYRRFQELATASGSDPAQELGLAKSLKQLGVIAMSLGRFDEAQVHLRAALDLLEDRARRDPSPLNRAAVFLTLDDLATLASQSDRHEDALAFLHRKLAIVDDLVQSSAEGGARHRLDLAITRYQLGQQLQALREPAPAEEQYRRSLTLLETVRNEQPGRAQAKDAIVHVAGALGELAIERGDLDGARRLFARRLLLNRELIAAEPANALYLNNLAVTLAAVARLDPDAERRGAAFDEALAIRRRMVEAEPDHPLYQSNLAASLGVAARLARERGDFDASLGWLTEALAVRKTIHGRRPDNRAARYELYAAHDRIGRLHEQCSRPGEAQPHFEAAHDLIQALAEDYPDDDSFQSELATSWSNRAQPALAAEDVDTARACLERAHEIDLLLVSRHPDDIGLVHNLITSHGRQGELEESVGRLEEAAAHYAEVIRIAKEAATRAPDDPGSVARLASGHKRLAAVLTRQDRLDEARPHGAQAVALRRRLHERPGAGLGEALAYVDILLHVTPTDLQDGAAALPIARELVAKTGGRHPPSLALLARAYHLEDEPENAVATMRRALALVPDGSAIRAEYLRELGEYGE